MIYEGPVVIPAVIMSKPFQNPDAVFLRYVILSGSIVCCLEKVAAWSRGAINERR